METFPECKNSFDQTFSDYRCSATNPLQTHWENQGKKCGIFQRVLDSPVTEPPAGAAVCPLSEIAPELSGLLLASPKRTYLLHIPASVLPHLKQQASETVWSLCSCACAAASVSSSSSSSSSSL